VGPERPNNCDNEGPSRDVDLLAEAQHNVIDRARLRSLGLSRSNIDYRVRTKRLYRKYPGIFAVGRPDLRLEGEFLAAVLACGPSAVLSHRSAARLWNLSRGGTYRVDVTAPRSVKPKPGIRLHRPLSLDAVDTTIVDGIPVTSVAQTLLDLAAPTSRIDVGKLLHEAEVQQVLDMREVWSVLARNPGAPGARALDWASREEVPFTRSGLEVAALELCREYEIPTPQVNQWVWAGDELTEVDFIWPDARLVVEVDGSRYHSTRWRRRRDAAKTAKLRAAGYTVHRVTDVQIAGAPGAVAALILDELFRSTRGPRASQ
jgi:hypothetical protein